MRHRPTVLSRQLLESRHQASMKLGNKFLMQSAAYVVDTGQGGLMERVDASLQRGGQS